MWDGHQGSLQRNSRAPEAPEASHIVASEQEQGQGEGCNEQVIWDWGWYISSILINLIKFFAIILSMHSTIYSTSMASTVPPPPGYMGGWVGLRVGGWVSQNPSGSLPSPLSQYH